MKRKRILWQLVPAYMLITLVALAAVSGFASRTLRHFFLDQVTQDLRVRALLLQGPIGLLLKPLDEKAIDEQCKLAGRISATRITVILPSGRVVGDSEELPERMDNHAARVEVIHASQKGFGVAIRNSSTLRIPMMYVAVPIRTADGVAGYIRTAFGIDAIDREVRGIQLRILFVGLIAALFCALLSYFISRRISRPMEEMQAGAERFAEGFLDHRLALPDIEELDSLAEALNRMAKQLSERIETIVRQRNELEAVLSSMAEGVVAMDPDERLISINAAAAAMLGFRAENKQNRPIQEAIRNPDLQQFIKKALASRQRMEADITLYHEQERVLYIRSTPMRGPDSEPVGILVVMNDVTDLRRLENMRKEFVANVSHEIKTPLTAIKGFVETLHGGGDDDPEERKRFLEIIAKHVDRLSAIVEDLLKLSRIEREEEAKKIHFETVALKGIFQNAISVCQSKAEAKQVQVELTCSDRLTALVDASLLEQAVVNLLDNAIQYSGTNGQVRIEAYTQGEEILIRVQDNGIGIGKEHLSRLFERFYRVDKARSRKQGGTGLGLAIVKHIVQAHGGTVAVKSLPGKGSTFEIYLPHTGKIQN